MGGKLDGATFQVGRPPMAKSLDHGCLGGMRGTESVNEERFEVKKAAFFDHVARLPSVKVGFGKNFSLYCLY